MSSNKLIRKAAVCEMVGLSPGTIHRLVKMQLFPNPLLLTPSGTLGFREQDVLDWIASRQPVTSENQRQVAPGSTKRGRPRLNKGRG